MSDHAEIEFVAGPTTPPEWAHLVGRKVSVPRIGLPGAEWRGSLWGAPGIMRDDHRFEIADVDMRSPEAKLLGEAAAILRTEPQPGEPAADVALRHARAQHLLLRAQLAILRRQQ